MSVYNKNNTAYGLSQALVGVQGGPVLANRAPMNTDRAPIGTIWVDQIVNATYILTSVVRNVATWANLNGGSAIFTDITTTGVGGITAQLGNITATTGNFIATAGNITATAGNISATAGSLNAGTTVTAGTGITATTGNITATVGNIVATAGNINATAGSITAGTTVTGTTGIIATAGGVTATAGGVTATAGDIVATAGNITTTVGSITSATTLTATLGDITATSGNVIVASPLAAAGSNALIQRKIRVAAIVQNNDEIGNILFQGYDGANYQVGSKITSIVTAAPGVGLIPADLKFWTKPNGAGVLASRLEINSAGNVTVNAPDAGVGLTVAAGGLTVTAGGATVTAGGLTVTAGGITATAGGITATAGDITATNGNIVCGTAATGITLPGPIRVISGAGAPAAGLALHVGDMYIRTDPGNANERIYVATVVATTWTNVTCAA